MDAFHRPMWGRNPLTGLSGLQLSERGLPSESRLTPSQSPYGAKWFATRAHGRGQKGKGVHGRNPLTGLSGLQPTVDIAWTIAARFGSQSPYGAKWFAT